MSKEQEVASGEGQDIKELLAKIEQLQSTNERLLNESKTYKSKSQEYQELQQKLKSLEDEKLQKEGNWQEMIKRLQEEKSSVEQKLRQKDNEILKSNVYSTVANIAKDAHDIDDLLAQSEFSKMIEVDEESLKPVKESVDMFVGKLREVKPYLFKNKKVASMGDARPSIDKPIQKDVKQMNQDERKALLKEAIARWN